MLGVVNYSFVTQSIQKLRPPADIPSINNVVGARLLRGVARARECYKLARQRLEADTHSGVLVKLYCCVGAVSRDRTLDDSTALAHRCRCEYRAIAGEGSPRNSGKRGLCTAFHFPLYGHGNMRAAVCYCCRHVGVVCFLCVEMFPAADGNTVYARSPFFSIHECPSHHDRPCLNAHLVLPCCRTPYPTLPYPTLPPQLSFRRGTYDRAVGVSLSRSHACRDNPTLASLASCTARPAAPIPRKKVLIALLGRVPKTEKACLSGYHRYRIQSYVFPAIRPKEGASVHGLYMPGLDAREKVRPLGMVGWRLMCLTCFVRASRLTRGGGVSD